MPKDQPACAYSRTWLKNKHGKNCFAPLTGFDYPCFAACCHLIDAWLRSDWGNQTRIETALRETLLAAQPCISPLVKDAIIARGDYGHVKMLWPRIDPEYWRKEHEKKG